MGCIILNQRNSIQCSFSLAKADPSIAWAKFFFVFLVFLGFLVFLVFLVFMVFLVFLVLLVLKFLLVLLDKVVLGFKAL